MSKDEKTDAVEGEDHADEEAADEHDDDGDDADEDHPEASAKGASDAAVPAVELRARPRPVMPDPEAPPPMVAIGKRFALFGVVLVGLTAGLYFLPANDVITAGPAKWKAGGSFDVTITLVKDDATNLACSASGDVAGRKCEFSSKTEKVDGVDDAHMLKPYTTTDQVQFLAAGLWSQPSLVGKLPGDRFTVQCKYHVEGAVKSPLIRWNPSAPWGEKNPDWNAGYVSDCKLNTP